MLHIAPSQHASRGDTSQLCVVGEKEASYVTSQQYWHIMRKKALLFGTFHTFFQSFKNVVLHTVVFI